MKVSENESLGIDPYIKTKPLGSNKAITDYLNSRGISLNTAREFCREVYYSIGDKRYFGLGNPHESGWAIRNKYWKGCTAQGFSHYKNNAAQISLFEGIFDLLSYVEMKKGDRNRQDFMVLNSLANIKGALPEIRKYAQINLFLDRDNAGKGATEELMQSLSQCRDQSKLFTPYKDLNEYWMSRESLGVKR